MHRMNGGTLLPVAPLFFVLLCVLTVPGQPAAASDRSPGSATTSPRDGQNAGHRPYLNLGMAWVRGEGTRFVDGEDTGHAALYGSEQLFDTGSIDDGLQFRLAAGVHLPHRLRAQLELGLARALDWRGNANYRNSGEHQPSKAGLDTRQLLLAGFHDFPGWELAPGRRARPFVGAGLGITDYRLRGYVQRFPEPDNPQGSLRRGPGGEIPFTALPEGSGQNFTWMWTAGIAVAISRGTHLDLSYRYTDAGEIRTDVGNIAIVRYRADGTRREIPVRINETSADDRTHAWLVAIRFDF